jgi:hypothetical protein
VQSHLARKFEFPDEADALVFIETGQTDIVWSIPNIELYAFGPSWERYKEETRSVTSWQILFNALKSDPSLTEADVENIGEATRVSQPAFTPFKRRKFSSVGPSPSESESSFHDVTFVPLQTEQGPTTTMSIESVLRQWSAVGLNFDLLHGMAAGAKRGNKELDELLAKSMTQLEVKIGELRAVLGDRPFELGTGTVFQELESHAKNIDELTRLSQTLVTRFQEIETKQHEAAKSAVDPDALKKAIYDDFGAALLPLKKLFAALTSVETRPGNFVMEELDKVKAELASLKRAGGTSAQTFGWSLSSGPPAPAQAPAPATAVPAAAIHPDIVALSRKVKMIEQQLDSQSVKVGMQTFSSRADADAWLKLNCPLTGSHAFFVDFHSLMALSFGPGTTTAEILKMEEARTKLNFTTPEEAIVTTCFHMEIPAFFGRVSTQATTLSAKVLPGLQSFDNWDMGDGDRGLRYDLKHKVDERVESWMSSAEMGLPSAAQLVAQAMLHGAQAFIEFLSNWITQFYNDCKTKGADDSETWKHISHTVRELCNILHNARRAGRGPFLLSSTDRASGVFWGSLQAHREMQLIMKRGMMAEPRLSHILNLHLRDNAVMKSEMAKVLDALRILKGKVATLETKATAKRPSGPGGRGGGGGEEKSGG